MPRIEIGTRWVLKEDSAGAGWVVAEKGQEKGRERDRHPSYYPRLEQALGSLQERQLRASDARTLAELLQEVRSFRRVVEEAIGGGAQ